jgi:hypothetical protein
MPNSKFVVIIIMAVMLATIGLSAAYAYEHNQDENFPPDCNGHSDYPHNSIGFGQVATKGRSFCYSNKDYLDVTTYLRLWSGSFWYTVASETIPASPYTSAPTALEARAAIGPCSDGAYYGLSFHKAKNGGNTWIAGTSSPSVWVTC